MPIDRWLLAYYSWNVTAAQIIEEIRRLDPKEQLGVIRFAYQLDAERKLSGSELSRLAARNLSHERARVRVAGAAIRGKFILARARRRFSRSVDRRGGDPKTVAVSARHN